MSNDSMETGFFKMEDVNTVLTEYTSFTCAQEFLRKKVETFKLEHPLTRQANLDKALKMINNAKNQKNLAFSVAQFILAHPSEGLKVI